MNRKFNDCVLYRDLRELLGDAVKKYGDKAAFREFDANRAIVDHSFNQLKADTDALGTKLLASGLSGKHFALIGESGYAYVVSYLAVANGAGVIVPIDKELTIEEMSRLLRKCDAEIIMFSDAVMCEIPLLLTQCPNVSCVINISALADSSANPAGEADSGMGPSTSESMSCSENIQYFTLENLISAGRMLINQNNRDYLDIVVDPEKNCTILFTSGTTGANKGVMLCHRNLTACVYSSLSFFTLPATTFSVLPINHAYEFNIHVLGSICGGATLCFNDSIKHVKDNLMAFKPYMSLMVPMIVEGLYKNIWKEAEKANLTSHLKYGIWFSNLIRKIGIDKRRLFFFPLLDKLGGNLRLIVCGGAPLNPDLVKGFDSFGISVYNGYGITECSPLISSNSPFSNVPGSVGLVVPGCKVRISDLNPEGIGEIQAKGDNVMLGYYKDEEATRQTFTGDGWFRTGDLGYMDRKGNVYITGRVKNLIILPNGKNVHPEELEEHLVSRISYIQEVVVYAQLDAHGNDSIITATAYLDQKFVSEVGLSKAKEIFDEDVFKVNRHLATYKRISQTFIRDTEFEKTATRKIKRNTIKREAKKDA